MLEYLAHWGHLYLVHLGVWISALTGVAVSKNGIPLKPHDTLDLLKSVLLLALVMAMFSSHAHSHYIQHFIPKITIPDSK